MTDATLYKRLGRLFGALCAAAIAVVMVSGATAAEDKSSLYDRLGGVYPIAATVNDLVDRIYVNGTLNANPILKAIHAKQGQAGFKVMVTNWVVENTGGPKIYSGFPMKKAHEHLQITDREFDVIMTECATTFYKFNVPKKEMDELMALLQSFRKQIVTASSK